MKLRTAYLTVLCVLLLPAILLLGSPRERTPAPVSAGAEPRTHAVPAAADAPRERAAMGPAVFPHDKHAGELGIECKQCHHETNAGPLTIPHMDYFEDLWIDCKVCHRAAGAPALAPQGCGACHHERGADIADETLSAKVVIHKSCWSCHDVGKGAAASAGCKQCHRTGG